MIDIVYLVMVSIFTLTASITYGIQNKPFISTLNMGVSIWGFVLLFSHVDIHLFLKVMLGIYIITFVINIMNKKHLPIIVSGIMLYYTVFLLHS